LAALVRGDVVRKDVPVAREYLIGDLDGRAVRSVCGAQQPDNRDAFAKV